MTRNKKLYVAKNSLRDVKSKSEKMSKMKWKRNTLQKFLEEIGSENRSYNSPWKKKKKENIRRILSEF